MKRIHSKHVSLDRQRNDVRLLPVSACFLVGALAVSVFGSETVCGAFCLLVWSVGGGLIKTIFSCVFGLLLLFLSATSLFSVCLIPASAFIFGAVVALQSATIIFSGSGNIFLEIIISVIIPGALLVPAFVAAAKEGLALRQRLAPARQLEPRRRGVIHFLIVYLFSATASVTAAAYVYWLLPQI